MEYHSTHSDDDLWYLTLRGKQKKRKEGNRLANSTEFSNHSLKNTKLFFFLIIVVFFLFGVKERSKRNNRN